MVKWYERYINQMPEKRIQIRNPQGECLVREIDPKLEVLMLHKNLQAISFTKDALPSTARYYHYRTIIWIFSFFYMAKTYYKFTRINPSTKHSLPQFLGFLDNNNVNFLKATVAIYYPHLYQKNQPLINAKKYEILLQEKLKKKAEEINTLLDAESKKENPSTLIQHEIFLEKGGKNLPSSKQLESELEQSFEDNNLVENNLLETSINEAIEFNQLGSTILVLTKTYLSLVLTQPCPNCNNSNLQNKIWNISLIGFQVKCIIECKKCNDIYEHTNEKEIRFAKATAAAGLAGGISHNALQSSLATIGITSQIGKKMYNNYQKLYFFSFIASAKSSTIQALQKCIEYAVNQNKEVLAVGFDYS
ncbi:17263_t:CDS:2 [Gigaspora margarita]|uniref:17263_t:CDS:1 n=1 Tax=Gigaspora margarita TaxID=4874 RepID=A0ABN7WBC7_GIGMA|nr:17263_t:CDS:2 [Gigaspora margarita]